jgi:hypothetical protein
MVIQSSPPSGGRVLLPIRDVHRISPNNRLGLTSNAQSDINSNIKSEKFLPGARSNFSPKITGKKMNITLKDICRTCGVDYSTARRWARDLPCEKGGRFGAGGSSSANYRLGDLVPAIRARSRYGITAEQLFELASIAPVADDVTTPLGDDAEERARLLRASLNGVEMARYHRTAKAFADGVQFDLWNKIAFVDQPRGLRLLILRDPIQHYIFSGQQDLKLYPRTRAAWGEYGRAHFIAVSTAETIKKLATNKEKQ